MERGARSRCLLLPQHTARCCLSRPQLPPQCCAGCPVAACNIKRQPHDGRDFLGPGAFVAPLLGCETLWLKEA